MIDLNEMFNVPQKRGFQITHSAECMEIIRAACIKCDALTIENRHHTGSGTAGYFTDPFDGHRYKITIQAITPDQEHT